MASGSMSVEELHAFFESQGYALGYIRSPGERASFLGEGDGCCGTEFTYGELKVAGVQQLTADAAERFQRVNGRPPRCFVDLGSGSGKVTLSVAALMPGLERSVGVELSLSRHQLAQEICEELGSKRPGLELADRVLLIHDDVRRAVASIAAADVIWVSNTCFPKELNQAIGAVLDEYAQEGAIVYSTRDLMFSRRAGGVDDGVLRGDAVEMQCSWAANHRAGTHIMVGTPLALSGDGAEPDERAFLRWAGASDDALLPPAAFVPAVADALLGASGVSTGEVLTELFVEDGVLAEIIAVVAEEHAKGLDFDTWEAVVRECHAAVRKPGSAGVLSWLCSF